MARVLKAMEVRQLLGLSPRQLALRRSELGKRNQYQHGYPSSAVLLWINNELSDLEKRSNFLQSAREKLTESLKPPQEEPQEK